MVKDFFYVGGGAAKTPEEVEFLKRKYSIFDSNIIKEIFMNILNLKVTNIVKPEIVGLPHTTYFVETVGGKEYCFRANLGNEEPETELLIEKLASDLARKNGVPSNKILYVDCSRKKYKFDFQIQERLFGKNPEHNFSGNQTDYDKLSFELGQIIGRLSLIKFTSFGRFDKEIASKENKLVPTLRSNYEYISIQLSEQIEEIVKAKYMTSSQGDRVKKIFENSKDLINKSEGSLVHYDLADHNFFYDPKTFHIVGIFDWEAVCVSDSMLDLSSAPTWKTLYEREIKLMEGYKSITSLPDNYQEKINIYKLRTIIWKFVHNLKFNIINKERIDRYYKTLEPFKII